MQAQHHHHQQQQQQKKSKISFGPWQTSQAKWQTAVGRWPQRGWDGQRSVKMFKLFKNEKIIQIFILFLFLFVFVQTDVGRRWHLRGLKFRKPDPSQSWAQRSARRSCSSVVVVVDVVVTKEGERSHCWVLRKHFNKDRRWDEIL